MMLYIIQADAGVHMLYCCLFTVNPSWSKVILKNTQGIIEVYIGY